MREGACQVAVGDGNIFIAGGARDQIDNTTWLSLKTGKCDLNRTTICEIQFYNQPLAYLFHPVNGWIKVPNMARGRSHPMCGLVTDRDGNRKIVVAGGYEL